jgi:membrane associated rhomboid family serine protease
MIPFSDGVPVQRFPLVNAALIVANFAVFVLYELPDLNAAISHASFYPCSIENACSTSEPWGVGWITAMFLHAGWGHLLGNMWFLAIFGKNVEDAFGRLSYLIFYLAGGFVATIVQTDMTLVSTASHTGPALGASGAIAAVLGAYFVLYPNSRVYMLLRWIPVRIPAWLCLGRSYQRIRLRCARGDSSRPRWTNHGAGGAMVRSSRSHWVSRMRLTQYRIKLSTNAVTIMADNRIDSAQQSASSAASVVGVGGGA